MVNSRAKGCAGERLWRDVLRAAGWSDARRGQQFSGHPDAPDVVGGPEGFFCEVKVRQKHDFWDAMQKAIQDAGSKTPYIAAKKNNKPWLVVLRAEDFLALVKSCAEQIAKYCAEQIDQGPSVLDFLPQSMRTKLTMERLAVMRQITDLSKELLEAVELLRMASPHHINPLTIEATYVERRDAFLIRVAGDKIPEQTP